jgi:large subunit ribosomal protein L31
MMPAYFVIQSASSMKPDIHPAYKEVKITCSCGNTFVTRSAAGRETLTLEVCAKCHPFYTGTQKMLDSGGRVERFQQKYGLKGKKAADKEKPAEKDKE